MDGDIDLMKAMRQVKSGKGEMDDLAETVDGVSGENNVANTFKQVFDSLYNSANSQGEMEAMQNRIKELVRTEDSKSELEKVTPEVVNMAVMNMKKRKMDISQGFSSEALLHAPDILFGLLALVFQDWLRHGTVTELVLVCAFIPLLKGSKDPGSTDNYRAIAGSSLILKTLERVILMIWGDQLNYNSIQFGFKQRCSTGTAT